MLFLSTDSVGFDTKSMDAISDDMIRHIIKQVDDCVDLLNLKTTCKSFDMMISSFALGKLMVNKKTFNYKPTLMCKNIDCYYDTWDLYEEVYNYGYRRYIHMHQYALNKTHMTINNKSYDTHSPYCSECFKQFIIIGDKKNVKNNFMENIINIEWIEDI